MNQYYLGWQHVVVLNVLLTQIVHHFVMSQLVEQEAQLMLTNPRDAF